MKKTIVVGGLTKDQREKELEKIKKKYEKKGYQFLEYIDNGMLKSVAIFEVSDEIIKKEKSIKYIILGIIIFSITFSIYSTISTKSNELIITPKTINKWPFKSNKATLKCYLDNGIKSPIVIINNVPYGLTGFADNKYGQRDIDALNNVWLWDDKSQGLRVDLSEVTNKALELCK